MSTKYKQGPGDTVFTDRTGAAASWTVTAHGVVIAPNGRRYPPTADRAEAVRVAAAVVVNLTAAIQSDARMPSVREKYTWAAFSAGLFADVARSKAPDTTDSAGSLLRMSTEALRFNITWDDIDAALAASGS